MPAWRSAACAQSGSAPLDLAAVARQRCRSRTEATTPPTPSDRQGHRVLGQGVRQEPARRQDRARATPATSRPSARSARPWRCCSRPPCFHAGHRDLNSEYGRLALEFDQVSLAQKLLRAGRRSGQPGLARDLRTRHRARQAGQLSRRHPASTSAPWRWPRTSPRSSTIWPSPTPWRATRSKAEPLLKRAAAAGGQDARVNQNLALVLGLQGKYDEAKVVAARNLPADNAAANVDYVRRIVKLERRGRVASRKAPPSWPRHRPPTRLRGPAVDDGGRGLDAARRRLAPTLVTRAPADLLVAAAVVHDRRQRQQHRRRQPDAERRPSVLACRPPDALVDGSGDAREQQRHHGDRATAPRSDSARRRHAADSRASCR